MFLDLAVFPKSQTAILHEDSREPASVRFGNKVSADEVCITNGPKSQSTPSVEEQDKLARFEQHIMPHMDAAYNLARWLAGNDPDAQDVVQESYLRAFKYFGGFGGRDSRAWLLRIVRNAFYDFLKKKRGGETSEPFDEELHGAIDETRAADGLLPENADHELVHKVIAGLPREFREILVLRELEGFSYNEISQLTNIPLGTVMSRLARARERLHAQLLGLMQKEGK